MIQNVSLGSDPAQTRAATITSVICYRPEEPGGQIHSWNLDEIGPDELVSLIEMQAQHPKIMVVGKHDDLLTTPFVVGKADLSVTVGLAGGQLCDKVRKGDKAALLKALLAMPDTHVMVCH